MPTSRRHLLSLAGLVATATLSLASPGAHAGRDTFSVSSPWEIKGADPAVSGFALQKLEIMQNLVDADTEGRLIPGLATEWTVSEDGLTWTFSLRSGVSFHDGTTLDAAAAVTALRRAYDQPGVLGKAPVASIEAAGGGAEEAIVVRLTEPFAALPALLAHATTIIPSPAAFDASGTPVKPLGTGPYAVTEFSPPLSLAMTRFDDYWGPAPDIAKVRYLATGRAETRALMGESGDADLIVNLDPSGLRRLAGVDRVNTFSVPIPRVVALKLNAGHPFTADVRARQALSLAIDRAGIAAGIMRFPQAQATQLFPPALGGWHDPALPPLAYDPDRAAALLAELGWARGGDGILTRDGKRFTLRLRTFPDRPELPLIATAVQAQWREIGVELDVSVSNYSEIPAGHADGSLEAALYARNYGLSPDPIGTVLADFGAGGGDWGAMNWSSPELADALAAIARTSDPAQRAPYIAKVASMLHAGLPVLPVVWYQLTGAVAADVENVIIDPLERSYRISQMRWAP